MKKVLLVLILAGTTLVIKAQSNDQNQTIDYSFVDSAAVGTDSLADGGYMEEGNQPAGPQLPKPKPFVKIVLNIDSTTNLITYSGVVEQEESGSDSLYIRAKRFGEQLFGKSKSVFEVEKRGQKLVMNGSIPAYAYTSKYTKRAIGAYEFKLTIWIKEGRYKYTISNLVHETAKPANGKSQRNYFEYYYTSTQNMRLYDSILRCADRDIKDTISRFQLAMREPIILDEDEW